MLLFGAFFWSVGLSFGTVFLVCVLCTLSLLLWLLSAHCEVGFGRLSGLCARNVGPGEAVAAEEAEELGGLGGAVQMDSRHLRGASLLQALRLGGILRRHLVVF